MKETAVKGLKVLRHKRTEGGGYFNEFLITKTPESEAQQQQTFNPTSSGDSWLPLQTPEQHPALQHHQQQQQQLQLWFSHPDLVEPQCHIPLLDGPATTDACLDRQEVVVMTTACSSSIDIDIVPVDAAPATASSSAGPADVASRSGGCRRQLDMAAGMSKMNLNLAARSVSSEDAPASPTPLASSASASESQRQQRRRERNRAAAARCRRKRQDQLDSLTDAVKDLETENACLETRVADLTAARSDLLRQLREHRLTCPESQALFGSPNFADLDHLTLALDTELATVTVDTAGDDEILLTPGLLLPHLQPHQQSPLNGPTEFKLERL